jgi:DNA-binding NarL/FixJ family response regulator
MNGYNGLEVCEPEQMPMSASTRAAARTSSSPTRIWLVDDSDNFRTLLADLLNGEPGIEVTRQFCSPEGALEALASGAAPDLILLDIQMGPYNGLDAIGPIKALAPNTHVLMLTTSAEPASRERAFREGASDFMMKSWSWSEIMQHIRRAMELGSAAGLVTAFLGRVRPAAPVSPGHEGVNFREKTGRIERGLLYLRDMLKFSPS